MESVTLLLIQIYLKMLAGEALSTAEQVEWETWHAAHPGEQFGVVLATQLALHEEVALHKRGRDERLEARFVAEFGEWPGSYPGLSRPLVMRPWFRIAVVLLVATSLVALAYQFWGHRGSGASFQEQIVARMATLLPDSAIAVQLADGRILVVDKDRPGLIAQLADQRIDLEGNELVFQAAASASPAGGLQAVHTPAGQPIWVRLPDDSRVYLNAVSQLQFPKAFARQERRVQFTGQAYFDIAKKKDVPFFAVTGPDSIEATGTQFSVRAYAEEAYKDVALFSGAVIVHHGARALRPRPLDVLRLHPNGRYAVLPKDVYELAAFKDDQFYYDSSRLATILGDLSRWYHVPLVHNTQLEQQGYYRLDTISRQTPLRAILDLLESTRRVGFSKDTSKIEVIR